MKLASHNSLSYYLPQWWVVPFNFMSKCQSLTIEQQFKKGVRLFDIRVKIVCNEIYSGHGIATYKVNFNEIFQFLNEKGGCTVRIIQERGGDNLFIEFVKKIKVLYPDIEFVGGQRKRDWVKMVDLPEPYIRHFYWMHKKWWMIPFPFLYAKRHNKENQRYLNDQVWSMFDFV